MDTRGYLYNAQDQLLTAHDTLLQADSISASLETPKKKGLFGRLTEKFKSAVEDTRAKVADVLTKERYLPGQKRTEEAISTVARSGMEQLTTRVEAVSSAVVEQTKQLWEASQDTVAKMNTVVKGAALAGTTLATLTACGGNIAPTASYMPLKATPAPVASASPEAKEAQWQVPEYKYITSFSSKGALDIQEAIFPGGQSFRLVTSYDAVMGVMYLTVWGIDEQGKAEEGKYMKINLSASGGDPRLSVSGGGPVAHVRMLPDDPSKAYVTIDGTTHIGMIDLTNRATKVVYAPENVEQIQQEGWVSSEPQVITIGDKSYMAVVQATDRKKSDLQAAKLLLVGGDGDVKELPMESGFFTNITGDFKKVTIGGEEYLAFLYQKKDAETAEETAIKFAKVSTLLQREQVQVQMDMVLPFGKEFGERLRGFGANGGDVFVPETQTDDVYLFSGAKPGIPPQLIGEVNVEKMLSDGEQRYLSKTEVLDNFIIIQTNNKEKFDFAKIQTYAAPIPSLTLGGNLEVQSVKNTVSDQRVVQLEPVEYKRIGSMSVYRMESGRVSLAGFKASGDKLIDILEYSQVSTPAHTFSAKSVAAGSEGVQAPSWSSVAPQILPTTPGTVVPTEGQPVHYDQLVQ